MLGHISNLFSGLKHPIFTIVIIFAGVMLDNLYDTPTAEGVAPPFCFICKVEVTTVSSYLEYSNPTRPTPTFQRTPAR